ncbi:alpha/beta fold hydrolase [Actinocorallia longicatena]|uniref:alpha/beta fold hydrolase n=1 Tax=Actinocorallia longicatena TaxID=111803 RepID=UPI003CD08BA8
MEEIHLTRWGVHGDAVLMIHGSVAWGDDPVLGFGAQRPLSERHRLLLMDRRGHGDSPDIVRGDVTVDALDVISLLDVHGPLHVVGHGSGGVVALLAAAARPEMIRSLALIEPDCYQLAMDDPVVADASGRVRRCWRGCPPISPRGGICWGRRSRRGPSRWSRRPPGCAPRRRPCGRGRAGRPGSRWSTWPGPPSRGWWSPGPGRTPIPSTASATGCP